MAPEQTESQSLEQLLELKRPELDALAGKSGVADPEQLSNKAAVAEAIVAAREALTADESETEPAEPPADELAGDAQAPDPEPGQGAGPNDTSNPSGESATVTYLGRPETIAHNDEGEPLEEDVYQGTDPWADNRPVNIAVGDSLVVSAEKAAQLDADFPGAFEIS